MTQEPNCTRQSDWISHRVNDRAGAVHSFILSPCGGSQYDQWCECISSPTAAVVIIASAVIIAAIATIAARRVVITLLLIVVELLMKVLGEKLVQCVGAFTFEKAAVIAIGVVHGACST